MKFQYEAIKDYISSINEFEKLEDLLIRTLTEKFIINRSSY